MIKKILRDYMEKLQNLIPDEIQEFVKILMTQNEINIIFPEEFVGRVLIFNIKIEYGKLLFAKKEENEAGPSNEEALITEINNFATNYKNIYQQIGKPAINPAIKKLLEVAKEIRNEAPAEIRWMMEIKKGEYFIELSFPSFVEQIFKGENDVRLLIMFNERNEIKVKDDPNFGIAILPLKKQYHSLEEGKEKFLSFLNELVQKMK